MADSLDAYYQELGRAGRDGEPAEAVLFHRPEDVGMRRFFAGSGQVDEDEIEQVAEAVESSPGPAQPTELREQTEVSASRFTAAVNRLEEAGAVEVRPDGAVARSADGPDPPRRGGRGRAGPARPPVLRALVGWR